MSQILAGHLLHDAFCATTWPKAIQDKSNCFHNHWKPPFQLFPFRGFLGLQIQFRKKLIGYMTIVYSFHSSYYKWRLEQVFCSSTSQVNATLGRMFLTDMKHLIACSADAKFPPWPNRILNTVEHSWEQKMSHENKSCCCFVLPFT